LNDEDALDWLPGIRKAFLPRAEAELDPGWRHVATYTVIHDEENVFTYRRGGGGSESRLHGALSVGVGGHVSLEDCRGEVGRNMLHRAAERELLEELRFDRGRFATFYEYVGLIAVSSSPVDRVHLGLVSKFSTNQEAISVREHHCLSDPRWLTADELWDLQNELESWSRIAAREVLGIPIGDVR
jgi:predicted NUDIX family phosphoesterase